MRRTSRKPVGRRDVLHRITPTYNDILFESAPKPATAEGCFLYSVWIDFSLLRVSIKRPIPPDQKLYAEKLSSTFPVVRVNNPYDIPDITDFCTTGHPPPSPNHPDAPPQADDGSAPQTVSHPPPDQFHGLSPRPLS